MLQRRRRAVAGAGAEACGIPRVLLQSYLHSHASGPWTFTQTRDQHRNEQSLKTNGPIASAWPVFEDKLYIYTAADWTYTLVLIDDELEDD